jgi:uncharacterized protein (DUF362 family)
MGDETRITRRNFIKGVTAAGALLSVGGTVLTESGCTLEGTSQVFRVENCPEHDGQSRHVGLDVMMDTLSDNGVRLYRTDGGHAWGDPSGVVDAHDVVLIKVNCQWKCRGTTNTDLLRGMIHRILGHPDGFKGEVVIIENGQGQGSFDGRPRAWGSYAAWPEIDNNIYINAEDETVLTVDHLVNNVFAGQPVSSFLLDTIRESFISETDHSGNGYRTVSDVSYPCFTSAGGHRIELREGIWNGSGYGDNIKVINVPVLKTHDGTGITGVLKHCYGLLSMADGHFGIRHYLQSGAQCGKMWSLVRAPDLNILDCIWVSHEALRGYPEETTHRANVLLAGMDPVALDYHASKHVLLPVGGSRAHMHNPDSFPGLINHLGGAQAFINTNGGIAGMPAVQGDENVEVVTRSAA